MQPFGQKSNALDLPTELQQLPNILQNANTLININNKTDETNSMKNILICFMICFICQQANEHITNT